jgi:hypothetical protein
LRSIEGVERTETSVVLSTKVEKTGIASASLEVRPLGNATAVGA